MCRRASSSSAAAAVAVVVALFVVVAACVLQPVAADEESHLYGVGDRVTAWLSKVGPYHNPQETYAYHSLPYCRPATRLEPETKFGGVGSIFDGAESVNSDLLIHYQRPVSKSQVCTIDSLSADAAAEFKDAISNHYWYQMVVDDLPVWGMVGEVPELTGMKMTEHETKHHQVSEHVLLYTHQQLSIAYNGNRIIEVNLTMEAPVAVEAGSSYTFTYGVAWIKTTKEFELRFNRYLDYSFFEHQIHWFSIVNSFIMVIFLCGLVAVILMRALRKDFAKYMSEEQSLDDSSITEESGWKQVHGDVFRRPVFTDWFAALIGTGYQLIILVFCVIGVAFLGSLYVERNSIVQVFTVAYALTSFVAGYKSGAFYLSQFHPKKAPHWPRVMVLTAVLLPAIAFAVLLMLNFIAISYQSINVVPMSSIVTLALIWLLVSCPLVVIGTILGRSWSGHAANPCRVNTYPRPIQPRRWYWHPAIVCLATGLLPFGCIFIEMYFVFVSFWNYKFYYVYGFMFLVYCILMVVCSCVTVVAVYAQLNAEDHRWAWTSFFASGSTAVWVFLYSVYYFFFKTQMSGFFQTMFYFGYMFLFCTVLAVLCGTIGYSAAHAFVYRIYSSVKVD